MGLTVIVVGVIAIAFLAVNALTGERRRPRNRRENPPQWWERQ